MGSPAEPAPTLDRGRRACLKLGGALTPLPNVPTIRFENEGQQVGCIEGANLRKAALDAGINPYTGLNNVNNCGGLGQCGTCVVEVIDGARNLSPAPMWRRSIWRIVPPTTG